MKDAHLPVEILSNFIEVFSDEIISSKSIAQSIIDSMNTIGYQSAEDNFYANIIPYGNDKNIVMDHLVYHIGDILTVNNYIHESYSLLHRYITTQSEQDINNSPHALYLYGHLIHYYCFLKVLSHFLS